MRILIASDHNYPAYPSINEELAYTERNYKTSLSSRYLMDLAVKGLAELGHEVFYWLPRKKFRKVPKGVKIVNEIPPNLDIAQILYCNFHMGKYGTLARIYFEKITKQNIPWIFIHHTSENGDFEIHRPYLERMVFVSQYAATSYGCSRFVYNGFDPDEYLFQEEKEDYFLFLSSLNKAEEKGLYFALELSQKLGFRLVVAGNPIIPEVARRCKEAGAEYVGAVYGQKKAKLLANAKGLIYPSFLKESFGVVSVEAMLSGTPVIVSNNGALPEIVSPDVGFVCSSVADYEYAIEHIHQISPKACRQKAINNYHYLQMAQGYVNVYKEQIKKIKNGFYANTTSTKKIF